MIQANISFLLAFLVTGCVTPPQPIDYKGMDPETAKALLKNRSATIHCGVVTSIYGTAKTTDVSIESTALGNNGAVISSDPETCKVSIQMLAKPVGVQP